MSKDSYIAGFWSGHDCSYCILKNGQPILHEEYERFIREKEPRGDSLKLLFNNVPESAEISHFSTCYPIKVAQQYLSFDRAAPFLHVIGHHQAHAANAFFSSPFDESLIFTIDGGGIETQSGLSSSFTVWSGKDNKIHELDVVPSEKINVGAVWTRCTRYIFNLQSGWPTGHQAGTVMAMAALGDPEKYKKDFYKMLTKDLAKACYKPHDQPAGANKNDNPVHPYLDPWVKIAQKDEQEKFDLAAGLQSATEVFLQETLQKYIDKYKYKNLCLSGGVVLNSVFVGKIKKMFPNIENVYVTATPHDGGLAIGSAQYVWYQILDNKRDIDENHVTPYLGRKYSKEQVLNCLQANDDITYTDCNDDKIVDLLNEQKIISIFHGGSESGRRALGNRSILADPRSTDMKDKVNLKVKHRQWFRPFAPSVLRQYVSDWFEDDVDSPYMSFVSTIKQECCEKIPAVVHFDRTARLQTVTEKDNKWYYNLLSKWHDKSGTPILLNTSFNDKEPICETPEHALNCFLGTEIDFLYFADHNILVSKK